MRWRARLLRVCLAASVRGVGVAYWAVLRCVRLPLNRLLLVLPFLLLLLLLLWLLRVLLWLVETLMGLGVPLGVGDLIVGGARGSVLRRTPHGARGRCPWSSAVSLLFLLRVAS